MTYPDTKLTICPTCKGSQFIQDTLPRTRWLPPRRICRTCNALGFVEAQKRQPGRATPARNESTSTAQRRMENVQ